MKTYVQTTVLIAAMILFAASCGNAGNGDGSVGVPEITVIPGTTSFSEAGGTGSFTVVLTIAPDGDVVIDVASSDTSEVLVSTDDGGMSAPTVSLAFDPSNWDIARTVTLVGQDDSIVDGEQSATITVVADDAVSIDVPCTITDDISAGEMVTYTADTVEFGMAWVPGGLSFPVGGDDSGSATVADAYLIAETEVTYELWYAVYDWAVNGTGGAPGEGRYSFVNPGAEGNDGTIGAAPTSAYQEPVTTIDWRDAMVWCNALTEYYNAQNGTSLDPVYYYDSVHTTPIRDSVDDDSHTTEEGGDYTATVNPNAGSFDDPYIDPDAGGFRLLTVDEWELAARYRGADGADGAIEYPELSGNYWTPGDYASGATADSTDAAATGDVAWTVADSGGTTHAVKGKTANALALFDMSGNVHEWNFDWDTDGYYEYRVPRGGCWDIDAMYSQVSSLANATPFHEYPRIGFRIGRSSE